MGKKRIQTKPRFYFFLFAIIFIVISMVYLNGSVADFFKPRAGNFDEENVNYAIFTDEDVYIIYKNKVGIRVPVDINILKSTKLEEFTRTRNYNEAINYINYIFPEKVTNYKVDESGGIDNIYNIPIIEMNGEKFVDTYALNSILLRHYYELDINENTKYLLDILNANGLSGFAGKTGKKLEKALGYKYNAANYEKRLNGYSYIENRNLTRKQIESIAEVLDNKYIKVRKAENITTLANAVIILGKEIEISGDIKIYGSSESRKKAVSVLKLNKYRNIKSISTKDEERISEIVCKQEDYPTAYKLSKLLGINKIIEDEQIEETIKIFLE